MRGQARCLSALVALCSFFVLAGSASASYLYRASFSGPTELEAPRRAAVEQATGNIFVVDSGHDRVLVFKPEGQSGSLLTELGVGVLDNPYGIAIRESGGQTEVYVSDAGNNQVRRFLSDEAETPSFSVDATYASPAQGPEAGQLQSFASPLALAPNGDLWVADRGANLVKRFDATGAHVAGSNFDGSSSPGGAFTGLLDLAANSAGDLYVVDETGDISQQAGISRAERFTAAGTHQATLAPLGPSQRPAMVAVNPGNDRVAVSGEQDSVFSNAAPTLHFFDAANAPVQVRRIGSAESGTVQGLAFRDGDPGFLYVVGDVGMWLGMAEGEPKIHSYEEQPPRPIIAPEIARQWAIPGDDGATLKARIRPGGEASTYRFEYGPTPAYGESTAEQETKATYRGMTISAPLENLTPGTTYYFRLVVENSEGEEIGAGQAFATLAAPDPCPNAAYRTGLSAELNECRAYELVTPFGARADVRIGGGPASIDGGAVCFNTEYPLAGSDPNGIKLGDDGFCAWRGAGGWETKWVTGPAPEKRIGGMGSNVYYLSPDGKRAVFASDAHPVGPDYVPEPGASHGAFPSAYMWEAGKTRWLSPPPPPVGDPPQYLPEGKTGGLNYASRRPLATSEDLTHGIFVSDLPLVADDENKLLDVYEWYPEGIRLVSRDAAGKAAGGRAPFDTVERYVAPEGTVSADGSRIFFQHKGAPLDGTVEEAPAAVESVYMREGDEVTLVSPRRGTIPNRAVTFMGASLDGEVAYLHTTQQLTPEPKQPGQAIYRYDLSTDQVELLVDGPSGVHLLGSSADGSTIVYRDTKSRALVVLRDGMPTTLGTLDSSDISTEFRVASPRTEQRTLRITADGSVVVFTAAGEFGEESTGVVQVYRWSAGSGLENISAGDEPAIQDASFGAYATFTRASPREEFLHQHRGKTLNGRVISEDGSRVFFETPEALVDRDVNGAIDVYEWHDDEVSLLTSGTGAKSFYFDNSADGKTVFFTTFNRLIPAVDRNSTRDLYVAQPGGGLPPPAMPPDCQGAGCQPLRLAPGVADSGSRAASEGNVSPGRPAASVPALTPKQRRQLAARGRTAIEVTVTVPGKVTARLSGRVDGRKATVATASRNAAKPGKVSLVLKLSGKARKQLSRAGRLKLTLEVAHSKSERTVQREVMLHD